MTTVLHDPKEPHRFQPDPAINVTYFLQVPTITDRPRYRAAVRRAGGRDWSDAELMTCLETGVKAILADDPQARDLRLQALSDFRLNREQFAAAMRAGEIDTSDQDAYLEEARAAMTPPPDVVLIEQIMDAEYEPYSRMLADRQVYPEYAGLVAARMFLLGWEGLEAEFHRSRDGVTDEVLAAIPTAHLIMIGNEIRGLLEPPPEVLRPLLLRSGGPSTADRSNGTTTLPETPPLSANGGHVPSSASADSASTH